MPLDFRDRAQTKVIAMYFPRVKGGFALIKRMMKPVAMASKKI
jgi:hypothetical protein